MEDFKLKNGLWASCEPPHKMQVISKEECKQMLRRGGYAVKVTSGFSFTYETNYWWVVKDSFGGMDELSSKMRNQVKKSLKQLEIRVLTKNEMLKYGYQSYRSAATNYKVKTKVPSVDDYNRWVTNAAEDIEFWGCFIKDTTNLIAIAKNRVHDDYVEYQVMKAIPDYQKQYYPFYGLIYEMNHYYLQSLGKGYVNDGARSITAHSNIQPFLIEKFKFKKAYCELNVHYQKWLKPIVNILLPFRQYINHPKIIALINLEAMRRGLM